VNWNIARGMRLREIKNGLAVQRADFWYCLGVDQDFVQLSEDCQEMQFANELWPEEALENYCAQNGPHGGQPTLGRCSRGLIQVIAKSYLDQIVAGGFKQQVIHVLQLLA
jgi:hypothetical protein